MIFAGSGIPCAWCCCGTWWMLGWWCWMNRPGLLCCHGLLPGSSEGPWLQEHTWCPTTKSLAYVTRQCHTSPRSREHRAAALIYFSKPDLVVFGFCSSSSSPLFFFFSEGPDFWAQRCWGNFWEVIAYFLSSGRLCLSKQSQMWALLSLLCVIWFSFPVPFSLSFGLACWS